MSEPQERIVVVHSESQALPAIASFFVPGLGQLVQGRVMTGIVWFGLAVALALTGIGLLLLLPLAVFCAIDAARYRPHAARIRRSPLRLILLIVLLGMLVGLMALVM